jgi:hypothetical protein
MCRNVLEIDGNSGKITIVNKIEDFDEDEGDYWPSTARP